MRSLIRSMRFSLSRTRMRLRLQIAMASRRGDVENPLVAQDAPGDPRQFVGQGGCQLVAMQPWRCVQKPCSEAEALPIVGAHQNDFCGLDEKGPEILAPSLGDPTGHRLRN